MRVGVYVCALLAPLLGCHSQAELHDRKSKIHFQIVFLLFLEPNSQAVMCMRVYACVGVRACVYSLKQWGSFLLCQHLRLSPVWLSLNGCERCNKETNSHKAVRKTGSECKICSVCVRQRNTLVRRDLGRNSA